MAAKTPASVGTQGYVDPHRGCYIGPLASNQAYIANGTYDPNAGQRLVLHRVYFADIDDGDTWASGINGIKACAWQGDALADAATASAASDGTVTFETVSTSDVNGWLWLLIDDPTGQYGKRSL